MRSNPLKENFSTRSQLLQFIKDHCQQTVLIANIPETIPSQRGQTCKLYALRYAMAVYKKFFPDLPEARKGDNPIRTQTMSLRKQAKTKHHSVQGEVYDPDSLQRLAIENHMKDTVVHQPRNREDYIDRVKKIIDANHSALVFIDVSLDDGDRGYAIRKKGENVHALTVIGYGYYHNELHFVTCQWGSFYLHKSSDIADSALQIEVRKPETFYKIPTVGGYFWYVEDDLRKRYGYSEERLVELRKEAKYVRTALPSQSNKILENTIFDVHPDASLMTKQLLHDFSEALSELTNCVGSKFKQHKSYPALQQLIATLNGEKENFSDAVKRITSISKCMSAIDKAYENDALSLDKNIFVRLFKKIVCALISLLANVIALVKCDDSYRNSARFTVFADIGKARKNVDKIREILSEYVPLRING